MKAKCKSFGEAFFGNASGIVVQWCNPVTLQAQQSGGRQLDYVRFLSAIPALGAEKRNFTFSIQI